MIPAEINFDLGQFKIESNDKTLNSIFFSHIIHIKKCDLINKELDFEFVEYYINSDNSDLLEIYNYFLTQKNIHLIITRGLLNDVNIRINKSKYKIKLSGGVCVNLVLPDMKSDTFVPSKTLICLKFKNLQINEREYK